MSQTISCAWRPSRNSRVDVKELVISCELLQKGARDDSNAASAEIERCAPIRFRIVASPIPIIQIARRQRRISPHPPGGVLLESQERAIFGAATFRRAREVTPGSGLWRCSPGRCWKYLWHDGESFGFR